MGMGSHGWVGSVQSEAITQSFHLPHPEYPGLVLALKQGWVLIGALPLMLWFT